MEKETLKLIFPKDPKDQKDQREKDQKEQKNKKNSWITFIRTVWSEEINIQISRFYVLSKMGKMYMKFLK